MKSTLLLRVIGLVVNVYATRCDEMTPLSIPIKEFSVSNGFANDSYMEGIAASVGTIPQDIVLLPWPELNNTWLYDQGFCDSIHIQDFAGCQAHRGHYYLESISTTWMKAGDVVAAGGAPIEVGTQEEAGIGQLVASSLGGVDVFSLNTSNFSIAFPIGIPTMNWDDGATMLHAMGLGKNSTIINALFDAGLIGSRVWSIFWGRLWADIDGSTIPGSIVFGGYDQQKTIGKGYTHSLDFSEDSGCRTGMRVYITKLTLHSTNVSNAELLEPTTQIIACIVPQHQLLLDGPASVSSNFRDYTGMRPINFSGGLHKGASQYNMSKKLDGDLTISISSGLEIRVPSDQFLIPFMDMDDKGTRFTDDQRQELLIGETQLSPKTAILGRYFLRAAYLMVDPDDNSFTLWQANPTTDSNLVNTGTTKCGNTSSGTGSQVPQAPSRLSGGSSAGIVIGVIAGVAIIGLGVLFYLRRTRPSFQSNQTTEPSITSGEASRLSELPVLDNAKLLSNLENELQGTPVAVSEMSGQAPEVKKARAL
ncbi:acid protease [Annulohypoxylon nitens]|nr:acid protease [Annulohypoxylon nitens]